MSLCLQCSQVKRLANKAKFNEINIISHKIAKRNIGDQLITIREEKHKEYLHNAGYKSQLLENNKNNENPKQYNNLQDRSIDKKQSKEINNTTLWPSGTCATVGDSMVNGTDENGCLRSTITLKFFTSQEQEFKISIST